MIKHSVKTTFGYCHTLLWLSINCVSEDSDRMSTWWNPADSHIKQLACPTFQPSNINLWPYSTAKIQKTSNWQKLFAKCENTCQFAKTVRTIWFQHWPRIMVNCFQNILLILIFDYLRLIVEHYYNIYPLQLCQKALITYTGQFCTC